MKWLLFFAIAISGALLAQEGEQESQVNAFKISEIKLEPVNYPWGRELSLSVKGQGSVGFQDADLDVTLYYISRRLEVFKLPLKGEFAQKWEPLNKAAQSILAGPYEVVVELVIANQSQQFRKKWQEQYGDKRAASFRENFFLDEKKFEEQGKEIRKFYVDRIRKLNQLYVEFEERKQEAMRVPQDLNRGVKNRFADNNGFSRQRWQGWFEAQYMPKIRDERKVLERRKALVFAHRYRVTYEAMWTYCNLLERIGRLTSLALFDAYKVGQSQKNIRRLDPYAIKDPVSLKRQIRRLHSMSAVELEINLKRVLGYLPPYGF